MDTHVTNCSTWITKVAGDSMLYTVVVSGGQTGEWALVQEEQMGPLLTPGKISLNR